MHPTTSAATLVVLATNSLRSAMDELAPRFARECAIALEFVYDPATLAMARIARGERADVVIIGAPSMDELSRNAVIDGASRRPLASSSVGVAVAAGLPHPPIGTVAQFKASLLAARSVAHTEAGASGLHFKRLIARLGIEREIRAKARTQPGGLAGEIVARGEADLVVQQIPELLAVPGIELVGPLPPDIQLTTAMDVAAFASTRRRDDALRLIEFLCARAAAEVFRAKGLAPA